MADLFVDSHAHIDGSAFDADRDEMIARAQAAGITHMVCIGASDGFESNPRTLALVEGYDWMYATVGIHPHDARMVTDEMVNAVHELASHPKVVAIGEMGLDYYYDQSPREAQQEVFRKFLRMSKEFHKPCVIHTRDAEEDTLRILQEEGAEGFGGVLHCFTGTQELADAAVKMGFYVSFSGILTFKSAQSLRDVAKSLPKDRVLVETDCPYLAPVPKRGKRNEPSYVVHTAAKLAELWGMEDAEVRRITGDNAARFFGFTAPGRS